VVNLESLILAMVSYRMLIDGISESGCLLMLWNQFSLKLPLDVGNKIFDYTLQIFFARLQLCQEG
jgi:hypothetical protein